MNSSIKHVSKILEKTGKRKQAKVGIFLQKKDIPFTHTYIMYYYIYTICFKKFVVVNEVKLIEKP